MNGLSQDVRYALRQLRQKPGFAVVAILTLALGIGANTAIYSLLDQALLRRLPVQEPERLVMLRYSGSNTGHVSSYGGDDKNYFSYPMYRDIRDRNSVFAGVMATDAVQVGVQWRNQPELVSGELVSGNYFEVLGVKPAEGRLFVPSDDVAQNANPVVVLSFGYWKRTVRLRSWSSRPEHSHQWASLSDCRSVRPRFSQRGYRPDAGHFYADDDEAAGHTGLERPRQPAVGLAEHHRAPEAGVERQAG